MIAFLLTFFAAWIALSLLIQGFYERSPILPRWRHADPIIGGILGVLQAGLLIGIGILGTFGAPAGSLEGLIYLTMPFVAQVRGYLEVVTQALLLSALLTYWVNRPGKKWMSWGLGAAYVIAAGLPLLSLVAPKR